VRRVVLLAPVALTLAACGGSGKNAAATTAAVVAKATPFAGTVAHTTAAGTVRFEQGTAIGKPGAVLQAFENGTASLVERHAHVYKQLPGGGVPGEIIVDGPITYTNANVQAALNDPSMPAWTRLDTRKLNARQRASEADELAHATAPAYLADGVTNPVLVGTFGRLTEYRGRVDPKRVERRLPAAARSWLAKGLRVDYPARPFPAQFWLDPEGRIRRVLVAYTTAKGTPVVIDTRYPAFGVKVKVSPPSRVEDITPKG
jgi:hypothetical protein